jgi:hypothetical protein
MPSTPLRTKKLAHEEDEDLHVPYELPSTQKMTPNRPTQKELVEFDDSKDIDEFALVPLEKMTQLATDEDEEEEIDESDPLSRKK